MSAFLVMLREGVEAALVVAIVLAYLRRLGRGDAFRWVWLGTAAAIGISLVLGAIIFGTVGELEGRAEEITEGLVALFAAGLLTWMIFWMAGQARTIKSRLQADVDAALRSESVLALAGLAFVAVLREGLESALFLISTTVGAASGLGQLVGGVAGVAAAVGVGYLVYRGGRRLNLRLFFRITGALILLFAAGLLAKGIHELQEAHLLGTVNEQLWRVGFADPDTSRVGEFLKSLFGWSPAPSFEMVLAWLAYIVPVGSVFLAVTRRVPTASQPAVAAGEPTAAR